MRVLLLVVLVACGVDSGSYDLPPSSHLAPSVIASNRLGLARLADSNLRYGVADNTLTAYAERCAIDIGLAPAWSTSPLTEDERRWISACLLAFAGTTDTSQPLLLRGSARVLSVASERAELFTIWEGAFWGDLFDGQLDWNACEGAGQTSGEFGGLVLRDCTEESSSDPGATQCGFVNAGICGPELPVTSIAVWVMP